jgi:hypothetical protein
VSGSGRPRPSLRPASHLPAALGPIGLRYPTCFRVLKEGHHLSQQTSCELQRAICYCASSKVSANGRAPVSSHLRTRNAKHACAALAGLCCEIVSRSNFVFRGRLGYLNGIFLTVFSRLILSPFLRINKIFSSLKYSICI